MRVIQIPLVDVITNQRLEAEYYDPKPLEYLKRDFKWVKIGSILKFCQYGSSHALNESNKGYPIFRLNEIENCFLTIPKKSGVLSKKEYESLKLEKNDVLFCRTNGNLKFVGRTGILKNDTDAAFASYLVRVRPDYQKILPEFLTIYLNSRIGRSFIERQAMQGNQFNASAEQLRKIPIPILDMGIQKDIQNLVNDAYSFMIKASEMYSKSQEILLKFLDLENFKLVFKKAFTSDLVNLTSKLRMDAEYFQPVNEKIENHLKNNFGGLPFSKINFVDITTGQYVDEYTDEPIGKPFVRGTDLKDGTVVQDYLNYVHPDKQIDEKKALEGDVVTVRVGTVGLSATIPKECEGGTLSDNLIRMRIFSKELNPYFLAAYLSSPIGSTMLVRNARGSVQQRLNQETLKEIIIPFIEEKKQREIADMVKQSHDYRDKAKKTLNNATNIIDTLIDP